MAAPCVAASSLPTHGEDGCSHLPLDAEGHAICSDETYVPQSVGVSLKPDAGAVKFSKLVFLGTGSAIPSPGRRNTSAIALNLSNASTILLDCGEATQHQLMKSQSVSFSKISTICITHLHGDHCFGLFGLLCTEASQGRVDPVVLVGPVGLRTMVTTVLKASGGFVGFPLHFLELVPEQPYPDLGIINGGVRLEAYPLRHRVASFGYVLREGTKPGAMLVARAKELGASGRELGQLKDGKDVVLASGVVVRSEDCVGPPIRARSIALLQDTYDSTSALAACQDVDLLIHECTYHASLRAKALEHGHSTSAMVGEYGAACAARMVVMTHFSNRYDTKEQTARKAEAARLKAAAAAEGNGAEESASKHSGSAGPASAAAIAQAKKAKQQPKQDKTKAKTECKEETAAAKEAATPVPEADAPAASATAAAPVAVVEAQLASLSLAAPPAAASSSSAAPPAASDSALAVPRDVLTLDELCAEALGAYIAAHPSHASPAGGVHAAEDFMVVDSKHDTFFVAPNKDRLFANELMDR